MAVHHGLWLNAVHHAISMAQFRSSCEPINVVHPRLANDVHQASVWLNAMHQASLWYNIPLCCLQASIYGPLFAVNT